MIRFMVLGLVLALVGGWAEPAKADWRTFNSGNWLVEKCEQVGDVYQLECIAYIEGVIDGSPKLIGSENDTSVGTRIICLPRRDFSADQAKRVVLKSLQEHPDTLHGPAALLVWLALAHAFPCAQQKAAH